MMHVLTDDNNNSAHFVDALWGSNKVAPDVGGDTKHSTISKPPKGILHTNSMRTHKKDKDLTNAAYVAEQRAWISMTLPKIEELKREIRNAYPDMHISRDTLVVKTHFKTGQPQITEIYYYAPHESYLFKRGNRVHRIFNNVEEVIAAMHGSNWQDMHLPDDNWHRIFQFCHELERNYTSFPHIFEH